MTITQKELIKLKQEYETLNNKLKELTEDELKIVTGGSSLGQLESNYQAFLEEDICVQEVSVALENQIIQPSNSVLQPLKQKLSHLEHQKYRNS